jgi:dTDP-4-amino-4,6-dideoxygalactose transaminase
MCPVAETAYSEQLSLPLFPGMADQDLERVVEALGRVLRG